MKPVLVLATLSISAAACSSPGEPNLSHALSVTAKDSSVQLVNASQRPVFYFVYERQAAALINWAPCVAPPDCPFVAPGTQISVRYSSIGGYEPGKTEAIVWWWYAVPGPADAPKPGDIHALVVSL